VVSLVRRLSALAAMLTLCVGNAAMCAGRQSSPEARMACCMNGTTCPMHKSKPHDTGSTRTISQAQADNCCAATSTRTQSSVTGPTYVVSNATALPVVSTVVVPVPVLALQEWRALAPVPVSPVPKHLLLSVLLV
jgi:hypothetical protein